jgi:hypothetical protein
MKAIRDVRSGPGNKRGSINDFLRLAARSIHHTSVRCHLINTIQEDKVIQASLKSTEETYLARLSAEVEELSKVDIFGQYTPDAIDKMQQLQDDILAKQIEEHAPSLLELLETLCRTTNKTTQRNRRRIVSILSIICFTRHPMKCNFLPAVVSLLLHSSGAKRHIYHITNSFGWTESYDSVLRSIDGLMNKGRAFIQSRIKESTWAIVYDNCDLSIGVSEQSDTKKNELISITTGLLIPGRCHPVGGIKQSDLHPEIELEIGDIFNFSYNSEVQETTLKVQLTTALIYEAIREVFPDVFTWYTSDRKDKNPYYYSLTQWPKVQLISPQEHSRNLDQPIALMPIQIDESTITGNIDIISNILRDQLGLDDSFFETRPVVLIGGDNKTLNRMWSAKTGAVDNTGAYDRLDHVVPLPGLFHAQMHVIEAIIKAHWGEEAKGGLKVDHCALRYSAGRMARRFVGPGNLVFTHGRTFIKDSLQARYIAELIEHLGVDKKATTEQIYEEMKKLAKYQLKNLIIKTADSIKYFSHADTQGQDKERAENLRFIRDAELFFVLSYGIKYGDIGLIRYTLAPLIPLFYGVKKVAYAREFLYLKRLIDSRYTSKEIADAIAATLLVNTSGEPDGFYAIDLANEFFNKNVKEVWANRRTSTTSVRQLSEFCTLNSIFLRPLSRKLHALWGHNSAGKHTRSNRKSVVLPLARELRVSMREDLNRTPYNLGWAEDKLVSGMKILRKRIGDFNNKFIQGNVESEEDEDSIFLNTASTLDLDIEIEVAPNVGLAVAVDALSVDREFDYTFDEDTFEEYFAEVDDHALE